MNALDAQRQRYAIRASVERGGFNLPDDYQPLALSPREREVLGLFADGLTRPQIARTLHIAPDTVAYHATNVRAKLGAHTIAQAVAVAYQEGLLPRVAA